VLGGAPQALPERGGRCVTSERAIHGAGVPGVPAPGVPASPASPASPCVPCVPCVPRIPGVPAPGVPARCGGMTARPAMAGDGRRWPAMAGDGATDPGRLRAQAVNVRVDRVGADAALARFARTRAWLGPRPSATPSLRSCIACGRAQILGDLTGSRDLRFVAGLAPWLGDRRGVPLLHRWTIQ
jgi:hypothetical protein